MGFLYNLTFILFLISGIVMVVFVLLRKSDVGGLSGAFGGMGDTAFGVKTQKHLDKAITWIALFFFVAALLLNLPKFRAQKEFAPIEDTTKTTAPETPTAPTTPTAPETPAEQTK